VNVSGLEPRALIRARMQVHFAGKRCVYISELECGVAPYIFIYIFFKLCLHLFDPVSVTSGNFPGKQSSVNTLCRYSVAHVEEIRLSLMTSAEQGSACLTPVYEIRHFLVLFTSFRGGIAFCIFTVKLNKLSLPTQ